MIRIRKLITNKLYHYNHDKYWHRRNIVVEKNNVPKFIKYYFLIYLKYIEGKNNSIIGTFVGGEQLLKPLPYCHII